MAYEKQKTDSCQVGPGTQTGLKSKKVLDPYVKPLLPASANASGQSQSASRGTDNKAK